MASKPFTFTANSQSSPDLGAPRDKEGGLVIQITGAGTMTLQFEGTVDGVNWVPVAAQKIDGSAAATTATAAGIFRVQGGSAGWCGGLNGVRVSTTAFTSGTLTVQGQPFVAT